MYGGYVFLIEWYDVPCKENPLSVSLRGGAGRISGEIFFNEFWVIDISM